MCRRGHGIYCMVSVLGWHDLDDGGLVRPAFWYADPHTRPDPADPRGILDYLTFTEPTSRYGAFAADAVDHDPACCGPDGPQGSMYQTGCQSYDDEYE
jgi:hypothetical protein